MSEDIKRGDVVQLRSGGPKMTVANVGKYNYNSFDSALCEWFVQDKAPWKKENGVFPIESLKKIKE